MTCRYRHRGRGLLCLTLKSRRPRVMDATRRGANKTPTGTGGGRLRFRTRRRAGWKKKKTTTTTLAPDSDQHPADYTMLLLLLGKFCRVAKQRLAFQLLVLGLFCLATIQGTALNCPVCAVGAECPTPPTCGMDVTTHSCFVGLGKTAGARVSEKGCVLTTKCNSVEEVAYKLGVNVKMTRLCSTVEEIPKILALWNAAC